MTAISIFEGWYRGANAAAIASQRAGKVADTTLAQFFAENDYDEKDAHDIADAVETTGFCFIGGGAAPEFTIALRVPA